MNHRKILRALVLILTFSGSVTLLRAQAPLVIDNVAERGVYTSSTWFRVPSTSGYTYQVLLDGKPVPTDVSYTVNQVDYHELRVYRTNVSTLAVTNRQFHFNVMAADRADTEKGLVHWTPYPTINSTTGELAGAASP